MPFAESVGELARLREEGKVRWIGLSNVSVAQIREAQAIVADHDGAEPAESVLPGSAGRGVVRYCAEQGIGFLAYSPTGGGRLNRKLPAHPVLAPIAARLGVSAHAVVLAWVLAQSPTVIVIPSARTVDARAGQRRRRGSRCCRPTDLAAIDAAEFSRAPDARLLPAHQAGPHREARAHRDEDHQIAPLDPAVPARTSSSASGSVAAVVLP